ncbi:hypothetical protein NDU88_006342 [Pleurodeles waltl]|uniref:Uncharacterized protein n=1 Tax=Pleurodeles waltl TaxID=8319 RepID=A0AAV7UL74_PLEWA|nr:hypothetical protein NDU88_006342 [Pleurodeles waltl]
MSPGLLPCTTTSIVALLSVMLYGLSAGTRLMKAHVVKVAGLAHVVFFYMTVYKIIQSAKIMLANELASRT